MPASVLAAVLGAALLHAGWNAAVKAEPDKLLAAGAVTLGAALLGALALFFLPAPNAASWPCIAASAVLQVVYPLLAVVAALRETSVVFATAIAAWVLRERVGPARIAGAVLVTSGAAVLRLA